MGDFLSVLRFSVGSNSDVVHAVSGYCITWDISNIKTNTNFQEIYTDIVFNYNADAKAYAFVFNEDI